MAKTIVIPGFRPFTMPTCYGLPTLFGVLVAGAVWFVNWSYHTPPVRFTGVKVEQVSDGEFVTLKITKLVVWNRLCPGRAEQEIRPVIAVENPAKVSAPPIKLDGHVINTPRHKGANAVAGDPIPERYVVLPRGVISPGRWQFRLSTKMSCWPWEFIRPIEGDAVSVEFSVGQEATKGMLNEDFFRNFNPFPFRFIDHIDHPNRARGRGEVE